MLAAIVTLAVTILPVEITACDRVDSIELNHYFDSDGRHVFTQLIFWRINGEGRTECVAWRMWKGQPWPLIRQHGRGWSLTWQDGKTLRHVKAWAAFESHLQTDPEMNDRSILSPCHRAELAR